MMFTRSITTYQATAYDFNDQDEKEVYGSTTFSGTSANKTAARKALCAAGVPCPKGCRIRIDEVETVVYGVTVEQFMEIAQPVERKAAEQSA